MGGRSNDNCHAYKKRTGQSNIIFVSFLRFASSLFDIYLYGHNVLCPFFAPVTAAGRFRQQLSDFLPYPVPPLSLATDGRHVKSVLFYYIARFIILYYNIIMVYVCTHDFENNRAPLFLCYAVYAHLMGFIC